MTRYRFTVSETFVREYIMDLEVPPDVPVGEAVSDAFANAPGEAELVDDLHYEWEFINAAEEIKENS